MRQTVRHAGVRQQLFRHNLQFTLRTLRGRYIYIYISRKSQDKRANNLSSIKHYTERINAL